MKLPKVALLTLLAVLTIGINAHAGGGKPKHNGPTWEQYNQVARARAMEAERAEATHDSLMRARKRLADCEGVKRAPARKWGATPRARSLQTGRFVPARPETVFVARETPSSKNTEPLFCAPTRGDLWSDIRENFGLTAGWRWDRETICPTCPPPVECEQPPAPPPHEEQKDPFFVGAELRLPVAERVTAFGNIDRDWTEAPHWNARVGLSFRPWGR